MEFNELVNRVGPKLKAIAYKLNYRSRYFDADDLYQEAIIDLWTRLSSGDLDDKTDSFILQGCFFFLKNYIRVNYKRIDSASVGIQAFSAEAGNEGAEAVFQVPDKRTSYELMVVDILVGDIMGCLTEREQEVFMMSLDDLTTRQIGQRLGISHPMVVKISKRIRIKCDAFKHEMIGSRLPNGR